MLNRTSVLRVLAAVIRDAGSAYSYYGFLPYVPSEFWSPIDVARDADESGEREQDGPLIPVRWHSSPETSTSQRPVARPAV